MFLCLYFFMVIHTESVYFWGKEHLACRYLYSIFKLRIFKDWIHTESVCLILVVFHDAKVCIFWEIAKLFCKFFCFKICLCCFFFVTLR